jgi:hypothetical protein
MGCAVLEGQRGRYPSRERAPSFGLYFTALPTVLSPVVSRGTPAPEAACGVALFQIILSGTDGEPGGTGPRITVTLLTGHVAAGSTPGVPARAAVVTHTQTQQLDSKAKSLWGRRFSRLERTRHSSAPESTESSCVGLMKSPLQHDNDEEEQR